MKNVSYYMSLLLFLAILCSSPAAAGELLESDVGTYVILDKNLEPIDMFYRLSKNNGKWVMEGKKPGGSWANISCDPGCEYRSSSETEVQAYFPHDWRANDISCIQNIAQAFCHYTAKDDSTKGGYVVMGFVMGRPIPMFVRRVPS